MDTKNLDFSYASKKEMPFIIRGIVEISKKEREDLGSLRDLKTKTRAAISKGEILIGRCSGKAVAFGWWTYSNKVPYGVDYGNEKLFCWVNWVYVSKAYRKNGIGTLIYKEIEKECRKKKVKEIKLNIFPRSLKSLEFHKRKGFKSMLTIFHKKLK